MLFSALDSGFVPVSKTLLPIDRMPVSLRQRSAECACNNIGQFKAGHLQALPPYVLAQLHDLLCRRSLPDAATAGSLLTWATVCADWSNFDRISDDSLVRLSACQSLQTLNLNAMKGSRCEPSAAILASVLGRLGLLQEVQLRRCSQVDDSVLDALTAASGSRLRVLNLQGCSGVTDAGVGYIAEKCLCLGSLNLSGCGVTDVGIARLADSPVAAQLTELQLNRCGELTDASIRRLVDACPQLQILTFTNCPKLTDESRAALEGLRTVSGGGGVHQLSWTVY